MANKDKLSYIIEERNRLIKHYKEKCEGLEEINTLIKTILFFLLCRGGETKIDKSELASALGRYSLKFRMDDSNYFISVVDLIRDDAAEGGVKNEEDKV